VQELLLAWFRQDGRDLPWRKTRDPYAILVSEVMAQQKPLHHVGVWNVQGESAFLG